jgi:DNA-binding NarL/FixJ family response regulator
MVDSPLGRGARVLIAEPAELVRRGIRDVLARDRRFNVVGEVAHPAQVLETSARLAPDVLLFAIDPPLEGSGGSGGVQTLREACRVRPELRVVVLVDGDAVENVLEPVRAGACGVLLRGAPAHVLLESLAQVLEGGAALDPRLTRSLFAHLASYAEPIAIAQDAPALASSALVRLSPREREVLRSLARGKRNKEIAAELGVSIGTVKTHLRHIFRKLTVGDRTAAVLAALEVRPPRAA